MSAFTPLFLGATCYVPSSKGVGYLNVLRTLERERITVALMVPSVLAFLEKYFGEIELPHLRHSLFCGEALPVALARKWAVCVPNARIFNVYGPTEATIFCTTYEFPRDDAAVLSHHGVVSIGEPLAGTQLLILNEGLEVLKSGETGELFLAGAQVTDRYWRNDEKTKEAFMQISHGSERVPVYRTGDVAFASDGRYFYCGRMDHQVKIAGYRVELGEIEFHARALSGVLNAAAVARRDPVGNCSLFLFLQIENAVDSNKLSEYRAQLSRTLPSYMIPQKIHVLPSFPLNQNGKIDRKQLLERVEEVTC
jgi:non-ribosomal peptide synthetase component F